MTALTPQHGIPYPTPGDGIRDYPATAADAALRMDQIAVPVGAVLPYGGDTAPEGWLMADGGTGNRTTHARLFAVYGTKYGTGDGSTTFGLPDLRSRIPVGLKSDEAEFDTLGETGGAKAHTLTTDQMPSHRHNQAPHSHIIQSAGEHKHAMDGDTGNRYVVTGGGPSIQLAGGGGIQNVTFSDIDPAGTHTHSMNQSQPTIDPTGGGQAHNNLQPYIVLNYIVKV